MATSGLLQHALTLHGTGFVPLPLRRGGKHLDLEAMTYEPLHLVTRRKALKELAFTSLCYQLSQKPPTRAEIETWFDGFAGNIGILGGHDGLVILDFDDPGYFSRWSAQNRQLVSRTPLARSPNGYHVCVRISEPIITSSMYAGARKVGHVKSLGGYVVASPSEIAGSGRYEWVAGQSPGEVSPVGIDSLQSCGLAPLSPLKRVYDRLRGRGYFQPQ